MKEPSIQQNQDTPCDASKTVINICNEINDLRAKISIGNNIIQHLEVYYDKELIDILNSFQLRCDILQTDQGPGLIGKLNVIVTQIKEMISCLSSKKKDLQNLLTSNIIQDESDFFHDFLSAIPEIKAYQLNQGK